MQLKSSYLQDTWRHQPGRSPAFTKLLISYVNSHLLLLASLSYKVDALFLARGHVNAVALGVREGEDLEVGVGLSNLLQPFVASTARLERIDILSRRGQLQAKTGEL